VAKKTIDFEAEERKGKILPPHKVEVTKHGKMMGHAMVKMNGIMQCRVLHLVS
jgi:hypothetical protein